MQPEAPIYEDNESQHSEEEEIPLQNPDNGQEEESMESDEVQDADDDEKKLIKKYMIKDKNDAKSQESVIQEEQNEPSPKHSPKSITKQKKSLQQMEQLDEAAVLSLMENDHVKKIMSQILRQAREEEKAEKAATREKVKLEALDHEAIDVQQFNEAQEFKEQRSQLKKRLTAILSPHHPETKKQQPKQKSKDQIQHKKTATGNVSPIQQKPTRTQPKRSITPMKEIETAQPRKNRENIRMTFTPKNSDHEMSLENSPSPDHRLRSTKKKFEKQTVLVIQKTSAKKESTKKPLDSSKQGQIQEQDPKLIHLKCPCCTKYTSNQKSWGAHFRTHIPGILSEHFLATSYNSKGPAQFYPWLRNIKQVVIKFFGDERQSIRYPPAPKGTIRDWKLSMLEDQEKRTEDYMEYSEFELKK